LDIIRNNIYTSGPPIVNVGELGKKRGREKRCGCEEAARSKIGSGIAH